MSEERVGISVTDNVNPNIANKIREIGAQARAAYEQLERMQKVLKGLGVNVAAQAKLETAAARTAQAMSRQEMATARVAEAQSRASAAADRQAASYARAQAQIEKANASIQKSQDGLAASAARTQAAQSRAAQAATSAAAAQQKSLAGVAQAQANADAAATRAATATIRQGRATADAATSTARAQAAQATATAAQARAAVAGTIANDNAAAAAARASTATNRAAVSAIALQNAQARQAAAAQRAAQAQQAQNRINAGAASAANAWVTAGNSANAMMQRGALSAKQLRAATNLIPAQFTDIVVSLQGGQAPLTVLLQQGGQLKDMFGGIGPAARALTTYMLGLINVWTAGGAVLGVLALAYYQGSQEADNYARALALTNNAAGTNVTQMQQMAVAISGTVGTVRNASQALTEMAGTGQIAARDLQQFTTTAIQLEKNVGISVAETAKAFAMLGRDPVEASKKLNAEANYLTQSVYEQIKALKEQGKQTDAARLAQETYDAALGRISKTMEDRLGYLEKAWRGLGNAAKWTWDQILNVGRPVDPTVKMLEQFRNQLAQSEKELESASGEMPRAALQKGIDILKTRIGILESDIRMTNRAAEAERERVLAEKAAIESQDALQRTQDKGLSKTAQMAKAMEEYHRHLENVRKVNPNSKVLEPAAVAAGESAIRKQYTDKGEVAKVERREAALAKVNKELDNEIRLQGLLGHVREATSKMDEIEEQMIGKRIKLTQEERNAIRAKVDQIIANRDAEQARNAVYADAYDDQKRYLNQFKAITDLERDGTITAAEAGRQRNIANAAYADFLNPLKRVNDELDLSIRYSKLHTEAMQVEIAVEQKRQELLRTSGFYSEAELERYRQGLVLQQERMRVQQAYNSIYESTVGQQKLFTAQQQALNMAQQNGLITMDQYRLRMNQLSVQMAETRMNAGFGGFEEVALGAMGRVVSGYQGMLSGLSNSFGDFFTSLNDGFANSVGRAVVYGESMKGAMLSVVQQGVSALISGLVKLGMQYVVNAAIGKSVGAASVAASMAMATTTAAAWAPAAAMVSLATLGGNAAPAMAGIAATSSLSTGLATLGAFKSGGWTGNMGVNDVAGVVHGREFVFDAKSTSAIGVDTLEQLRSGARRSGGGSGGASGSGFGGGWSGNLYVNVSVPEGMTVTSSSTSQSGEDVKLDLTIDSIENALAQRTRSGRGNLVAAQRETFGLQVQTNR